ncbi:DUF3078 domain-containing protein [Raineya orbicola]|jgi:hypothetical protein|uniref:DUF3078 domain-containing protein n=1 Tax=Raineya orbicola TaxID=2016530 RepID=A0A2N3I9E0_9BACT|nr:DUF3078 domain-containing protein [Raineya orbicola]PKQ66868.1 hypothetical protein Rain11_2256 [Raineya orbicola]
MKKFAYLFVCFLLVKQSFAQKDSAIRDTSYWKKSAQMGLGFNQASFSDNWKAGGVSSVALASFLYADANYLKDKISWDNSLRLNYGIVKNKGQSLRKNQDRILFDSKFGYKLSKNWNLFASLNFLTQFDAGFEYERQFKDNAGNVVAIRDNLISKFFAPAFLTEAAGLEYKPVNYFWVRFGVASMRQTFVFEPEFNNNRAIDANGNGIINEPTDTFDPKVNYGVAEGKSIRNEVGILTLEADFNKEVFKNIVFQAHFWSFTTYENPLATDVRSELAIIAKVNKYVNVKLGAIILYDQDQDLKTQYAQNFTLNFAMNWDNKKK